MLFTYHHSDNSECLAGEHFIEALIPTWHLLDLQYRNVVALEGTVANLQASRSKKKKTKQKTTIRHIGETEKAFKLPVIFIKSISVLLKNLVMLISTFVVVPLYPIIPKEYWVLILPVLSLVLVHTYLLKAPMYEVI